MPVNPAIYAALAQPQKSGLATIREFMELREAREDRKLAREDQQTARELQRQNLALQQQRLTAADSEAARKAQTDAAIRAAFQESQTPDGIDHKALVAKLYAIDPDKAMEIDKSFTERADTAAKRRADDLKAEADRLKLRAEQLEAGKRDLDEVIDVLRNAKTDQDWQEGQDMAELYGVKPQLRNRNLVVPFTPDAAARAAAFRLSAKEQADLTAKANQPATPPAPFTLTPGAKRFNPDGTVIAEVPPTAGGAAGGFTLAPGATRYDAQGNPIASAPNRPPQAATGRPVTSGDSGRISDYKTSLDDLAVLKSELSGVKGATGTSAKIGAMLPNAVTDLTGWGTEAKQKQAVIDRVKQVIGKALEGGVLRKEDESKYEKILPTIADTADVVAAKLAGLEKAIGLRLQTLIDSLEDSGFDVAQHRSRTTAAPVATKANPFR